MPVLSRRALLLGIAPVLVLAAIAVWYWWPSRPADANAFFKKAPTTEIRVAPEISGRLARFLVEPGQMVQSGQPVAVLGNPELWAAVGAARAQVDKARSDRDRVYAGVRDEQVQALQREIEKARAAHTQAEQELARKSVLAARSDASQQELDTATAQEASKRRSRARPRPALCGGAARPTRRNARWRMRPWTRRRRKRRRGGPCGKMLLHAPSQARSPFWWRGRRSGRAGRTVLTLVPDNGTWFGFNLREDALHGLAIGSVVPVHTTAQAEPISAKLVEMRNWGEFAVWRAARATGDHDLNTLFLRLDPVTAAAKRPPARRYGSIR
jgi:HlyD family secretion protein